MKIRQAILLRNLSIYYLPKLVLPPILKFKKIPYNPTPPFSQFLFNFRFFASKHDQSSSSIQISDYPMQNLNSDDETEEDNSTQVEDVSNEELKKRIERYDKGDEGAILDIFEGIVRRKLAGKHGAESDDEILKEFRDENPLNVVSNDDEVEDSDFGGTDSED